MGGNRNSGRKTWEEEKALDELIKKCVIYLNRNFSQLKESKQVQIACEIIKKRMKSVDRQPDTKQDTELIEQKLEFHNVPNEFNPSGRFDKFYQN